jgi:hypothetical protein
MLARFELRYLVTLLYIRFGFVTFVDEATVNVVLNVNVTHVLDGKTLDLKNAFKRSDEDGGKPPVRETKKPFVRKAIANQASAQWVESRKQKVQKKSKSSLN